MAMQEKGLGTYTVYILRVHSLNVYLQVSCSRFHCLGISHLISSWMLQSHIRLTPKDIESPESSQRLRRWLRIRVCNVDEVTNRYLRQRNDLRLLNKLVSKIQNYDNRDVNIRRDKSFSIPSMFYQSKLKLGKVRDVLSVKEHNISTRQQQDPESDKGYPGSIWLKRPLPR